MLTLAAGGREITLSDASLAGLTGVSEVWWPYVVTPETWPPPRVPSFNFSFQAGVPVLSIPADAASVPATGQKVRLWWTKNNTVNTLDSATATTLTTEGKALVALGAAGCAAISGALDRSEVLDRDTLTAWGDARLKEFRASLDLVRLEFSRFHRQPLTTRDRVEAALLSAGRYTWSNVDLDSALRQSLAEYSRVQPVETETVITLSTTGREIVLSPVTFTALAGLVNVLEVYWPWYTTGGEVWPPNRVAGFRLRENAGVFTLFLFANDGSQPKTGDKVRLWWTKPHTINTLDGSTATTLSAEGESLVIMGAVGYAAVSCLPANISVSNIETLRKWGSSLLSDFRSKLEKIRATSTRVKGEPFGGGWKMDKWDVQL